MTEQTPDSPHPLAFVGIAVETLRANETVSQDFIRVASGGEFGKEELTAALAAALVLPPAISPETAELIRQGLAEAARGETVDLGSFAHHLDEEGH